MVIGRNISKYRKQQRITQKELAERVGITREYLSNIENGKEQISLRLLALIANYLNVTIQDLVEDYRRY